jgi:NADPH-dependent 2,4-dienoyl-CoA reductase/sulfur reductase-like enzyme/peroxiredoxin family protein/TusA-related sulfurtransferase/rhodanese-related sulfurtransferase
MNMQYNGGKDQMGKKIIIIGGVAGGASCAARMRRLDENAGIVMIEKGDYISFANCGLPYYIGSVIRDRDRLLIQTPESFGTRFNVDVRIKSEAIAINSADKTVTIRKGNETYQEKYDALVLAPGAAPIIPPMKGVDAKNVFSLRSIPDTDRITAYIEKKKTGNAVIAGGGFIGLEMAENLRRKGFSTTIVEMLDQVFAPADKEMASILHQHLAMNGVRLVLGTGVKEIVPVTDEESEVVLTNGEKLPADIVIMSIGVRPDTDFAKKSGVNVNERGAICVDCNMRTNVEHVYAVGDAVEVVDFVSGKKIHVPLAGPANRMGRIAADNIAGIDSRYKNTQGTAICKIFDLTAAVTGLNEKNAKRWNIPYIKSYTHSTSHAGYYPGAFPLTIKIMFNPQDGRLLGAQVIGKEGIDKRIDVFAVALRHGLTIYDIADLELAYAPPFGSAKDPVNIAGFTAQNIMDGRMPVFFAEDIASINYDRQLLLDVRTEIEYGQGNIAGSMNIPLDNLRNRIGDLDRNKEILVYCQVGLRGYLATRVLLQNGFKAKNMSGGYKTYLNASTINFDGEYIKNSNEATCSSPTAEIKKKASSVKIDACGLQCPGPIMRLKKAIDSTKEGEFIEISATDQGFAADVPAWCVRTNNILESLTQNDGIYTAVVRKGEKKEECGISLQNNNRKTFVIFSNDFDKIMASFIIANGALSMGCDVTMFFTFWGLNLLRKNKPIKVKKTFMERMFSIMMPRGPEKTRLSKMDMFGLGTAMMRMEMKKKNVFSLPELIGHAKKSGVRLVACTMSMDIMGIKKEELIDGIELGGVAYYLNKADNAGYNVFI